MKHKPNQIDMHVIKTTWKYTGSVLVPRVPIQKCTCESDWNVLERLAKAAAETFKERHEA